jgi:hypothetical protein
VSCITLFPVTGAESAKKSRWEHPAVLGEGTSESDALEQRPPWLVSVASAGHFRPLKTFFGK